MTVMRDLRYSGPRSVGRLLVGQRAVPEHADGLICASQDLGLLVFVELSVPNRLVQLLS